MRKQIMILKSSILKSILLAILFGLAFVTNGFAAIAADSCAANSANRQLDYWLGNWKIGAEGSSGNAHSTVSLSLDKCIVVENWDGGRGHSVRMSSDTVRTIRAGMECSPTTRGAFIYSPPAKSHPAWRNLKARVTRPVEKAY